MATSLTAKVKGEVNFSYGKTDTLAEVAETLLVSNVQSYTFGLGSSKADVIYRRRYTVTGNTDITVYGTLTDIFGDTVNTEVLRGIFLHNRSSTAGDNIYVGPLSCSNPLLFPWVDANGKNLVGPGGTLLLDNPLDGYAIEDNADTFRIQYQGTSGSIDVDLLFLGNSGDFVSSSSTSSSSSKSVSSSSSSVSSESSSSSRSASTSSSSTIQVSMSSSSSRSSMSSQSSSSTSSSTVVASGSSSSSTSSETT